MGLSHPLKGENLKPMDGCKAQDQVRPERTGEVQSRTLSSRTHPSPRYCDAVTQQRAFHNLIKHCSGKPLLTMARILLYPRRRVDVSRETMGSEVLAPEPSTAEWPHCHSSQTTSVCWRACPTSGPALALDIQRETRLTSLSAASLGTGRLG